MNNRLTMTALIAGIALLASLGPASVFAESGAFKDRRSDQYDSRDDDRRDERRDERRDDRRDERRDDRRDERRDDRRDHRSDNWREDRRDAAHRRWKQDRREARWDRKRHNGFWYDGRFYRGKPSRAQQRARDFGYGYYEYRRGDRLDGYERRHYRRLRERDYARYRLYHPPHGYEWRRSNTGDFILAAVATGVILSVILSNY